MDRLSEQAASDLTAADALGLPLPAGHWSQWSAAEVRQASDILFHRYDRNNDGTVRRGAMRPQKTEPSP